MKAAWRLAAAYGISVTGTMAITSILFGAVAPAYLGWSHHKAYFFTTLFLVVDIAFFSANMLKFFKGGYVPMTIAIGLFAYMLTWKKGREVLSEIVTATGVDIGLFAHDSGWARLQRVSGVAVFTSSNSQKVPNSLLHHLKHNRVLHEIVIIATVVYEHSPEVKSDRVKIIQHRKDFYQVLIHTGFMQDPNVPEALKLCRQKGLCIYPDKVSYYVGRESLLVQGKSRMPRFQALVFAWITRNAQSAADYFSLPPGQVVELGCQVVL
jgi:KUP system potassium uptake protein